MKASLYIYGLAIWKVQYSYMSPTSSKAIFMEINYSVHFGVNLVELSKYSVKIVSDNV